ncbi:MAG: hypothetical protein AAF990_11330 [Bacteroidota bacterium]
MNRNEKYDKGCYSSFSSAFKILLWGLVVCFPYVINAQGWFQTFPIVEGQAMTATVDGGFVVAGRSGGPNSSAIDDAHLTKLDADGLLVWSNTFGGTINRDDAITIAPTADGGYVAAGSSNSFGPSADLFVFKADKNGRALWSRTFGGPDGDRAVHITPSNDGGFLLTGCFDCFNQSAPSQLYAVRIDANGNSLWARTYNVAVEGYAAIATDDGGFAIASVSDNTVPDNLAQLILVRIDSDGNTLWNAAFGSDTLYNAQSILKTPRGFALAGNCRLPGRFDTDIYLIQTDENGQLLQRNFYGGSEGDQIYDLLQLSDGGFAMTGLTASSGDTLGDVYLVRTQADGNQAWELFYGNAQWQETGRATIETADGGLVVTGTRRIKTGPLTSSESEVILLKTEANGRIGNRLIRSYLREDQNSDCTAQDNEAPLAGWKVALHNGAESQYTTTDDSGYYELLVVEDDYDLRFVAPSSYWGDCSGPISLTIDDSQDTFHLDAAFSKANLCPELAIDVSTDWLRPCKESEYVVQLQNLGTLQADNAYALIAFDESMQVVSATRPFSIQGPALRFELGDVPVGARDSFRCRIQLDCNAIVGQTHCVTASIFPDSICNSSPSWDQSSVAVQANCLNDSLFLDIRNVGAGDMMEALNFIIVEDQIVDRTGSFQLPENQAQQIGLQPRGKSIHFKAQQSSNHPGRSFPAISVEGCGRDSDGDFSRGFVTSFAEDDANPFKSVDCQESLSGSMLPDKRAYPKGNTDQYLIYPNTDLEYHLLFQNNSLDTIRQLVFRDTLSPQLDLLSIQAGASSHPYRFRINPDGSIRFVLDAIELLPASVDSARSTAFVKYRIGQRTDNPPGTRIQNRTALYVPFKSPNRLEDLFHQIAIPQLRGGTSNGVCEGELFMGMVVRQDTILSDTLSFGGLFDSLYSDSLLALPTYTQTTEAKICQGERYEFQGISYTESGLYSHPSMTINGCDSSLFLSLEVLETDTTIVDTILSRGDIFKDVPYFSDSTIVERYTSSKGCDSLVIIQISILTSTQELDKSIEWFQVFPNPFQGQAQLELHLKAETILRVGLRDLHGRQVHSISDWQSWPAGRHRWVLYPKGLAAGLYFLDLQTDRGLISRKIIIEN